MWKRCKLTHCAALNIVIYIFFFKEIVAVLKCHYDKNCCSRSLSIPVLYLAKMQYANSVLRLNFTNMSDIYDFSFKLSTLPIFISSF